MEKNINEYIVLPINTIEQAKEVFDTFLHNGVHVAERFLGMDFTLEDALLRGGRWTNASNARLFVAYLPAAPRLTSAKDGLRYICVPGVGDTPVSVENFLSRWG